MDCSGACWGIPVGDTRSMELPQDLPILERSAVRLVVLDIDERVLLFQIREPLDPDQRTCWELPGGGIDAGETYVDAALRELVEETGIHVGPRDLGSPTWRRRVTFRHASFRRLQDEVVVAVRLTESAPDVSDADQLAAEQNNYLGFRWWEVAEIEASTERFYPGRLPALIRQFLEDEQIEEPFEFFS
jgi:8-oxo-dGTP pyrophosphatase MutT (NUDIX family)